MQYEIEQYPKASFPYDLEQDIVFFIVFQFCSLYY